MSGSLGGDLQKLWWVANSDLAEVSRTYTQATTILQRMIDNTDDATFGPAFAAWREYETELHYALFLTGSNVHSACTLINQAIEQYLYVDGDTEGELTAIGKKLEDKMDKGSMVSLEEYASPPTMEQD